MEVIVVTIGDELLTGHTVDTNSAWMGRAMNARGFSIAKRVTIGDSHHEIVATIREALLQCDVVLVTGGLGPTSDDVTKKALCQLSGSQLVLHQASLQLIKEFLALRGYPLSSTNQAQALVPEACTALLNKLGAVPGMWFEIDGKILVSMPGVPYEMEYLMTHEVLPRLEDRFHPKPVLHRWAITQGIPEAMLADRLQLFEAGLPDFIRLAYLPSQGIIKLRLSAYDATPEQEEILNKKSAELLLTIPDAVVGNSDESLSEIAGSLLLKKNKTLALAESCTGGYIAHLITQVPGSSAYFKGGVVAYSNQVKMAVLGVNPATLEAHGAVSTQTAAEMAEGVLKSLQADYALATTGIAGPDGGTAFKPVGMVCVALATCNKVVSETLQFGKHRNNNIIRTANTALGKLIRELMLL